MKRRDEQAARDAATRAMEDVLRAEHDAAQALEDARAQGQALLATARDDALALVNGALERSARWQRGHAEALRQRLDERRASAERAARPPPDAAAIRRAVERVAARLTGADDEPAR